jgi:NADPH:quinone reductase-like Zn-dependent oxidoreductase
MSETHIRPKLQLFGMTVVYFLDVNENQNVVKNVLHWTGGWGVDYWMDTVSSESASSAFDALAFHGELVLFLNSLFIQFSIIINMTNSPQRETRT